MEGVHPVNTHKIQHEPPTPDGLKLDKQTTADSATNDTGSPQDTSEDGMNTDNNSPNIVEKNKNLQKDKENARGSGMLIAAHLPIHSTLDVEMDTADGKGEREQGKEDDESITTLDA
jgi:hypothetical protein